MTKAWNLKQTKIISAHVHGKSKERKKEIIRWINYVMLKQLLYKIHTETSEHFSSGVVFRNQRSFPYEYIYGETTKPYFVKLWIISYFKCFVCFFFSLSWIYGVHSSKTVLLFFSSLSRSCCWTSSQKKNLIFIFFLLNVVGVLWTDFMKHKQCFWH